MEASELRERARRLARIPTSGLSDANVNKLINDCVRQLATDVMGLKTEAMLDITARFDTLTTHAINLTIVGGSNALAATDIAITATARADATGATVAADLQTRIRAAGASTATVTFANYYFTIDSIDGTSITVVAPVATTTYADATDLLFGKTGTSVATTWVGEFPQDCTLEADLPSGFMEGGVEKVTWDSIELTPLPELDTMAPIWSGDPGWYGVRNSRLRLVPAPTSKKVLKVWYRGAPADVASSGFDTSMSAVLSAQIPAELHTPLAYLLASEMLNENHEADNATPLYARYWRERTKYIIRRANQNTAGREPGVSTPIRAIYKVIV